MEIEVTAPIKAQPLDDEGDPVGKPVSLKPGMYTLRSGLTLHDDGSQTAWIVNPRNDKLYDAQLVRPS